MAVTLKVDYDGRIPGRLASRIGHVVSCNNARVVWWALAQSSSGRGWHLTVRVTGRWSAMRIVAAQACLGSDWRRESYNMARVLGLRSADPVARTRWNVLYTRKFRVRIHKHGGC